MNLPIISMVIAQFAMLVYQRVSMAIPMVLIWI